MSNEGNDTHYSEFDDNIQKPKGRPKTQGGERVYSYGNIKSIVPKHKKTVQTKGLNFLFNVDS